MKAFRLDGSYDIQIQCTIMFCAGPNGCPPVRKIDSPYFFNSCPFRVTAWILAQMNFSFHMVVESVKSLPLKIKLLKLFQQLFAFLLRAKRKRMHCFQIRLIMIFNLLKYQWILYACLKYGLCQWLLQCPWFASF